jgi:hypothetical protein
MDPYSGRTFTDEQAQELPSFLRNRLVQVTGHAEDVARMSQAAQVYSDLTSDERARRRKARKVARQSRRANRH